MCRYSHTSWSWFFQSPYTLTQLFHFKYTLACYPKHALFNISKIVTWIQNSSGCILTFPIGKSLPRHHKAIVGDLHESIVGPNGPTHQMQIPEDVGLKLSQWPPLALALARAHFFQHHASMLTPISRATSKSNATPFTNIQY